MNEIFWLKNSNILQNLKLSIKHKIKVKLHILKYITERYYVS